MKQFTTEMLALLATTTAIGQKTIQTKQHNQLESIANKGYHPVASVENGKAIQGKPTLAVYHQGVSNYFKSDVKKDLFKKNVGQYEPAYGGGAVMQCLYPAKRETSIRQHLN